MVDVTQNLTGTVTSVKVPDVTAAPRVNVSQGDPSQVASLGTGAPVNPVPSAGKASVEVNSAASDVLASMQNQPAPIDIDAVTRIREAISANEYPLNYAKIADGLAEAFESLT